MCNIAFMRFGVTHSLWNTLSNLTLYIHTAFTTQFRCIGCVYCSTHRTHAVDRTRSCVSNVNQLHNQPPAYNMHMCTYMHYYSMHSSACNSPYFTRSHFVNSPHNMQMNSKLERGDESSAHEMAKVQHETRCSNQDSHTASSIDAIGPTLFFAQRSNLHTILLRAIALVKFQRCTYALWVDNDTAMGIFGGLFYLCFEKNVRYFR